MMVVTRTARARFLWIALPIASLAGCGGSAPSTDVSASASSSGGGDNEAAVLLRVRVPVGARYTTRSEATTQTGASTVQSRALGAFLVESADPADGTLTLVSQITSMEHIDPPSGQFVVDPSADLSGVRFRRRVNERARVIGAVEMTGTTEQNFPIAELIRTSFEQTTTQLPEAPVRAGDTWSDHDDLTFEVEGTPLRMRCESTYRMMGTEGVGDALAARIDFTTRCDLPATELAPEAFMEVHTRATGSLRVAIRDGMTGRSELEQESETRILGPGMSEPIVMPMRQSTRTETLPLLD